MKSQKELEGRRKHLELPAIDREMLTGLLDNFEEVIAAGTCLLYTSDAADE